MDTASRRYGDNPSFSSSLLDEIYRSIDERDDEQLAVSRETTRKKQNKFGGSKSSNGCFEKNNDGRRACLIQKLMENKVCEKTVVGRRSAADLERSSMRSEHDSIYFNSSSSSCDSSCGGGFSSSEGESMYGNLFKPKPIRTSVQHDEFIKREQQRSMYGRDYRHEESLPKDKHEGKFVKTKSKALKIYSDLKKQPISPGGRLSAFLNSLFATGNTKKPKTSSGSGSGSGSGGYADASRSNLDRKSKSANVSTCSSASSFSRSCLSNTPSTRGKLSNGIKRSVRFYPVSVIVDEDCQPCGHKSLYEEETKIESVKFAKSSINEELKVNFSKNNRHIQEAARNLLKNYQKKFGCEFDSITKNLDMNEDEDQFDDDKSDSSSDLFELDNLSTIGMHTYQEELPVYETTNLRTNRAIAKGFFM